MWFVGLILLALYCVLLTHVPHFILQRVLAFLVAAGMVLVVVRWFAALGGTLLWSQGAADEVRGPEPAYYTYFCDKAWRDYKIIVRAVAGRFAADAAWGAALGVLLFNPALWFLALTVWAILPLVALPALALALLLGAIHLAVTGACSAFVYASGLLLRFAEAAWRRGSRIEGRCGACHHNFDIPVYVCDCGARHKNLVPGAYGPFLRRCRCGRELQALLHLGRNMLTSVCPKCERPLNTSTLMVRDLFIPVVGGVSAGKSSMMLASMIEFSNPRSGLTMIFPAAKGQPVNPDQRQFEAARASYMDGRPPLKTPDRPVQATQLRLEDRHGRNRLLFLYDAAGEIFRGGHEFGNLPYYRNIHGLVFLIDPLTLLRRGDASSSVDAPEDIYDQVVRTLIDYAGRRGIRNIPMAVVVTKCDFPGLLAQITSTAAPPQGPTSRGRQSPTPEQMRSLAIRQWLVDTGGGSVVRTAESYFRNVRFFACSALGRAPDGSRKPFHPQGVLAPWAWLLRDCGLHIEPGQEGAPL